MTRAVRLLIVGLLSTMLTLAMTGTTAVAAAPTVSTGRATPQCVAAQQQDSAAAANVAQKQKKFSKTKKKFKKAVKLNKKSATPKRKAAVKKAKKKKNKAKNALRSAKIQRVTTSNQVIVFCGTLPGGAPVPPGTSTPGVSPLAPLCAQIPQLKPLCDATQSAGNTSPLAPLCAAIPQLAPLCAVNPGDLADPAQLQALLDLIRANFPQGAALIPFLTDLLTRVLSGDLQGAAATLGTTPQVLATLIAALAGAGIPGLPSIPGLPTIPGLPSIPGLPF